MKHKLNPKKIRQLILKMAYEGQTPHIACAFSIVEILCALFEVMNFNPKDAERDYLILSKGHGAMALYACMFEMGHLNQEDIDNYAKNGSRLHGACEATIPGVDATTGSLGHGLPIAVGIAYALKKQGKKQKVYCIVGDGEMQEGSCFEALRFSVEHRLNNFVLIIDENRLQAMRILPDSLEDMFCNMGFSTNSGNGHAIKIIKSSVKTDSVYPSLFIGRTKKGHGVTFMENDNEWHYKKVDQIAYVQAMMELDA